MANVVSVAASFGFDPNQYLTTDQQNTIAQGQSLYNAVSTASQGISAGPHGTIQISDKEADAALTTGLSVIATAVPIAAPFVAAFLAFYAVAPHAGAGPGVCSTNPPPSSSPSDLVNWPYFKSWSSFFPSYPTPTPGTFEAFANSALEYNYILGMNCYVRSPPAPLLATLVASWNAKHSSSVKRTVTRTGLNSPGWGFGPGYDPIAEALEESLGPNAPSNSTASIVINNGPIVLKPLVFHTNPTATTTAATTAPSAAKTAVGVTGATFGTAALAGVAWSLATGKAWDWAFSKAWDEIKEMATGKAVREMRETRRRRRRSTRRRNVR